MSFGILRATLRSKSLSLAAIRNLTCSSTILSSDKMADQRPIHRQQLTKFAESHKVSARRLRNVQGAFHLGSHVDRVV